MLTVLVLLYKGCEHFYILQVSIFRTVTYLFVHENFGQIYRLIFLLNMPKTILDLYILICSFLQSKDRGNYEK